MKPLSSKQLDACYYLTLIAMLLTASYGSAFFARLTIFGLVAAGALFRVGYRRADEARRRRLAEHVERLVDDD